jgi:hypothetical protein
MKFRLSLKRELGRVVLFFFFFTPPLLIVIPIRLRGFLGDGFGHPFCFVLDHIVELCKPRKKWWAKNPFSTFFFGSLSEMHLRVPNVDTSFLSLYTPPLSPGCVKKLPHDSPASSSTSKSSSFQKLCTIEIRYAIPPS